MARWYRSGRYYGRNRGSYYRKRYNNYSGSRKAWGNMKSAKQQADQATITINVPTYIDCFSKKDTLTVHGITENVVAGVRPINIYDLLSKSDFYSNYANMYDEFKIDKIKVKLLPTSWTISTGAAYKNITVYTAWDRSGLSKDQVYLQHTTTGNTATEIGTSSNTDGLYCLVGENITTYSSSESRVVNPNTNTSIVRWLNPKTMGEKSQWLSTGLLKKWYKEYDKTKGRFIGIPTGRIINNENKLEGESYGVDIGETTGPWVADGTTSSGSAQASGSVTFTELSAANRENPCFLLEDSGFQFKPTLLVGVYPPQESNEATNIVNFNVEAEVVCTFRGLRKAKVVAK